MTDDSSEPTLFWSDLPEDERIAVAQSPETFRDWYFRTYENQVNRDAIMPLPVTPLAASVGAVIYELAECEYVGLAYLFDKCRERGFGFSDVVNALREMNSLGMLFFVFSQSGDVFVDCQILKPQLPTLTLDEAVAVAARQMEAVEETESAAHEHCLN